MDYSYLIPVLKVDHCWSKIKVEISDVSEFTVTIKVKDNGKYQTFTGKGNEEFEATIDIDYWGDYCLDYKVKVTAVDVAGNELEWEKEIDGLFGGLLDVLTAIWDLIAGAFLAAFELMMAALNFLVDLILDTIKSAFNAVFAPIIDAYNTWTSEIYATIDRIMTVGDIDEVDVNMLYATFFTGAFFAAISALILVLLYVIEPLIFVFLNLLPGGGPVTSILTEMWLMGAQGTVAQVAGEYIWTITVSTLLVMVGELIAKYLPGTNWIEQVTTATGTFLVSIFVLALQKHITKEGLSSGDKLGLGCIIAGYMLAIFQASFGEFSKHAAIFGAIVAIFGLIWSLKSPDIPPKPSGFIDEAVGSVLTGVSIWSAVNS